VLFPEAILVGEIKQQPQKRMEEESVISNAYCEEEYYSLWLLKVKKKGGTKRR